MSDLAIFLTAFITGLLLLFAVFLFMWLKYRLWRFFK
jgi:hypothetical protein